MPGPSVNSLVAWLGKGRRRVYATGAALVIVAVVLVVVVPSGGAVSIARMQELLDAAYSTTGTTCVASSHGRDVCKLSAGRCSGTIVVAPLNGSNFTIVDAHPEQLQSGVCDRGEAVEGEAE